VNNNRPLPIDYWGLAESLAEQYNVYFPPSFSECIDATHLYDYLINPDIFHEEDLRYLNEDEMGRGYILGIITECIRRELEQEEAGSEQT
jgi:hypothetical protein